MTDTTQFEYFTVELSLTSSAWDTKNSKLSLECVEWLEDNFGKGANSRFEWIIALPNLDIRWGSGGYKSSKWSYNIPAPMMYFRTLNDATIFKLAWGGK